MRLPHYQVSDKFLTVQAPLVAGLLRIPLHAAWGLGMGVFAFAVDLTSSADKPPDGVLLGPDAGALLEAAVGWGGAAGAMVDAFMRAGLIERLEIGLRVRGTDRYARTWAKNGRRNRRDGPTGTVAAGSGTKPAPCAPEPAKTAPGDGDGDGDGDRSKRSPPMRAAAKAKERPTPPAAAPPPVPDVAPGAKKSAAADNGGAPPLIDRLEAIFGRLRGVGYARTFGDDRALERVLEWAKDDWALIERRWEEALQRTTYPKCSTLIEFGTPRVWNASPEEVRTAGAERKGAPDREQGVAPRSARACDYPGCGLVTAAGGGVWGGYYLCPKHFSEFELAHISSNAAADDWIREKRGAA